MALLCATLAAPGIVGATKLVADIDPSATGCTFFVAYKWNPTATDFGPPLQGTKETTTLCTYLLNLATFPYGNFTFVAYAQRNLEQSDESAEKAETRPAPPNALVAPILVASGGGGGGGGTGVTLGAVAKGDAFGLSVSTPAVTTQNGSALVVTIGLNSGPALSSVTDNKGNTFTQVGTATTFFGREMWTYIASNIVGGAGHIVTVTFASNAGAGMLMAEAVGAATSPLDTFVTWNVANSSTQATGVTAVTAQGAEAAFAFTWTANDVVSITPGVGYTDAIDSVTGGGKQGMISWKALTAVGAQSTTFTYNPAGGGGAMIVTLKAK